jgi:hypothetical protein
MTQEIVYIILGVFLLILTIVSVVLGIKIRDGEFFFFIAIFLAMFSIGCLVEGITPYFKSLPSIKEETNGK